MAIFIWPLSSKPVGAAEPVLWSIEQLNAAKANWSLMTSVDVRVEGRVSSQIKNQIRFQQCPLTFVLPPELERRVDRTRNLEVTGRFQKEDDQLVFAVRHFKSSPNDLEALRSKEVALKNATPDDWYQLADWARNRGQFYQDEELKEAELLYAARGVALKHSELASDDSTGRLQLAEKADRLGLPERVGDEFRHEALRVEWSTAGTGNRPDLERLQGLIKHISATWPDAAKPGTAFPTELDLQYHENPLGTYRAADPGQRQILRRMLFTDVSLHQLSASARKDGSDGDEIAAVVLAQFPERSVRAQQFLDAKLSWRLGRVPELSKADVTALADDLRKSKRTADASEALRRWLVDKEQKVRPQTAPEFVELADDYISLLHDERRAVALLNEAHRKEPDSIDVERRFQQLGYAFNGVAWIKQQHAESPVVSDGSRTASPLSAGMLSGDVTRMLGEPGHRSRVFYSGGTQEFWVYGRAGEGSRLVIELRRNRQEDALRVSKFYHH